jgi:hypothetical protein
MRFIRAAFLLAVSSKFIAFSGENARPELRKNTFSSDAINEFEEHLCQASAVSSSGTKSLNCHVLVTIFLSKDSSISSERWSPVSRHDDDRRRVLAASADTPSVVILNSSEVRWQ